MGSKQGIFIILDDNDGAEFEKLMKESGEMTFVLMTDFVDIARNVACHFFIHNKHIIGKDVIWNVSRLRQGDIL